MRLKEEMEKCKGNREAEQHTLYKAMQALNEQLKLYEGFLKSYPKEAVVRHFTTSSSFKGKIVDINVKEKDNNTFSVNITIGNDAELLMKIIHDMETYGYYLLNKYKEGDNILYIFEPKYNIEATTDIYNKYGGRIYHTTNTKLIEKIKKNGLIPKTTCMIGDYPDRVYFSYNKNTAIGFAEIKELPDKTDRHVLLTIQLDKEEWTRRKFFYDNNMIDSIYTLENIPPQWIIDMQEFEPEF